MIDNVNVTVGYWFVDILANRKSVFAFYCPTLKDARMEARRIRTERRKENLPTKSAIALQVIGREKKGRSYKWIFDQLNSIELLED